MPDNEINPGTIKEGEIAVQKTEFDTLTALRTRYTPPADGKYNFDVPKEGKFTTAHVEKTAALAAKLGLSNDAAKELVPFLDARLKEQEEAFIASNRPDGSAFKTRVEAWEAEALADPILAGGDKAKLLASAELGRKAVAKFFSKEVADFLEESGFGSHPGILKGFAALGRMMAEGKLIVGEGGPPARKSNEEVFFGEKKVT